MTLEIGKYNTLEVIKVVNFGIYLDGGDEHGEILMPTKYIPEGTVIGDEIRVFVYLDSEERLIATTETPLGAAGSIAFLKVRSTTTDGAFLDWALSKDLFLPFREQVGKVSVGQSYFVFIYVDPLSNRLVCTMKVDKFLNKEEPEFVKGQEVDIIIQKATDLGYKAIIPPLFSGMLYHNEVFTPVSIGLKTKAFIKNVREDGKIDLSLNPIGVKRIFDSADVIKEALEKHDGFLPLTDKSDAQMIGDMLGMSKKSFKQGLGKLYKLKQVVIEEDGVRSV